MDKTEACEKNFFDTLVKWDIMQVGVLRWANWMPQLYQLRQIISKYETAPMRFKGIFCYVQVNVYDARASWCWPKPILILTNLIKGRKTFGKVPIPFRQKIRSKCRLVSYHTVIKEASNANGYLCLHGAGGSQSKKIKVIRTQKFVYPPRRNRILWNR